MRVILPFNPLKNNEADEPYQVEYSLLKKTGVDCSLFDFDVLDFDEFNPFPAINDELVLYRGWMLNSQRYEKLVEYITNKGGIPFTSYKKYLRCHHLSNWYDSCLEYTPETVFFADNDTLLANLESLDWGKFFVKDYVKSNSTERGSVASSPKEVLDIVELLKLYRGEIEGGIAIRRVEKYQADSEIRYFVFNGNPYSPDGIVPDLVSEIAKKIDAPFYSVDIARRKDGVLRLIELGDGQVSDMKSWHPTEFIRMLDK